MIVWRKATEIRGTFVEYRCLADYAGIITDLKNNKEIPEYSSNVVYFSRSRKRGEVESKLMYSIINKEDSKERTIILLSIRNMPTIPTHSNMM